MKSILDGHWKFEGEQKELPKNLKRRKDGNFDLRTKAVKVFLADSRWSYEPSFYEKKFVEVAMAPNIMGALHRKAQITFNTEDRRPHGRRHK